MKKIFSLLFIALLILNCAACGAKSETEQRIERVMMTYFDWPDEETIQIVENPIASIGLGDSEPSEEELAEQQKAEDEFKAHINGRFNAEDFTENFYDGLYLHFFTGQLFPSSCVTENARLTAESVTVELESKQDRTYTYTANLKIEKDGNTTSFVQTGKVQTDEGGRISSIKTNPDALIAEIEK